MLGKLSLNVMKTSVAILFVVALLLPSAGCGTYDSAFDQAEYQIKLITQDGAPLNGVQLEVRDSSGNISYGYPVTDYYLGSIPTSDPNGVVTFHHVFYFLEWGGYFFFGCATGGPPEYDLLFTKNGDLIHSVKFLDLDRKVDLQGPWVTRTVLVCDEATARASWMSNKQDFPIQIVEQSREFRVLEQTVVISNR